MKNQELNVLYICPMNCFKIISGADQRSYLLLEALSHMDNIAKIDVLYCGNEPFRGTSLLKIGDVFQSKFSYQNFIHKSINGLVRSLGLDHLSFSGRNIKTKYTNILARKHYDLVVFRYIATVYRCGWPYTDVIIDVDDLPSEVCTSFIQTSGSFLKKAFLKLSRKYLIWYEKNFMTRAKNCFFSNRQHVDFFEKKGINGIYLPNIPFSLPNSLQEQKLNKKEKNILFVGYLKWKPNIKGIMAFVNDVWPIVYNKTGNVRLRIVGKGLSKKYIQQFKNTDGIDIVGFVENIQKEYEKADVVIVPITQGSGTNIKILEALAFSKPVVATSYALRGYEKILIPDRDLLIADNPQKYAEDITKILSDSEYSKALGSAGNKIVAKNFSKKFFINQVRKAFE